MRVSVLMDGLPEEFVAHIVSEWGSTTVASRGRLHDLRELPALAVRGRGRTLGLAFYSLEGEECELVALDVIEPGQGVGTMLFQAVVGSGLAEGCRRLWLVTTNDNTAAMAFYQHLGMRCVAVHRGAVDDARASLKPEIPCLGCDGIEIHDEIEFELQLG